MRKPRLTSVLPCALFLLCALHQSAMAQSTLVTVPSTDVVSPNKLYLEFDFTSNYAWERHGSFQSYGPRAVVGVGRDIEVGVNVAYTHLSGASQPIEVQPNIKWRFYNNEKNGVAAAAGCVLYAPVTHRTGADTFGLCYMVFSKKMNSRFGPRFTGGTYTLLGRDDGAGARSGAIAGYEQPLHKRVSFVMDWFSGRNRFGYVTPGFSFATSRRSVLYSGYSIGNSGPRNHALFGFYGVTF